jgi:hypothetical protein
MVVLAAAALLVLVPATSAKPKLIKLKGEVLANGTTVGSGQTVVSLREGSKKVGKLSIGSPSCGGTLCESGGTANLKIGKITGKAQLSLHFKVGGGTKCALGVKGACKPPKYGTGKITRNGVAEAIRVNTGDPSKLPVGGHFGVVLG